MGSGLPYCLDQSTKHCPAAAPAHCRRGHRRDSQISRISEQSPDDADLNRYQEHFLVLINLKTAVVREKAVQAIDVHREWKHCVVTFWVMSQFLHFLGASKGCADIRDSTAVFRINAEKTMK